MATPQWIQVDPTLDRDDVLQFFVNVTTKNRVYGRTDGTLSDHIHLRFLNGTNSGLNLDPVTGDVTADGNALGDVLAVALLALAVTSGAGAAVGAGASTATGLFSSPSHPNIPAGLIFPPA
jgi:hypothetical protein